MNYNFGFCVCALPLQMPDDEEAAQKRGKNEIKEISSNSTGSGYDDVDDRVRRK